MCGLYDLSIYLNIYTHVGTESQENYSEVAYKTIDNVNFIHYIKKRGKIFHFFEVFDSPFILESKMIFNIYIYIYKLILYI